MYCDCKVGILFAWFTSILEANCMFLVVSSRFPHSGMRKTGGNDEETTSLVVLYNTKTSHVSRVNTPGSICFTYELYVYTCICVCIYI